MAGQLRPRLHPRALACLALCAGSAFAQTAAPTTTPELPGITVLGGTQALATEVGGFGDAPWGQTPQSATVIEREALEQSGARSLAGLYRLDASVTDAYNAGGYVDYATVRGLVLDTRYNYRRDGLPISAETSLPLDHLERVELLRGTSGIQAGTSAPGGLFNLVVKRPGAGTERRLRVETNSAGNALVHADLSGRAGEAGSLGYRLNLLGERLNGHARGTQGQRQLAALAVEARLSSERLLEAEWELSHRRQRSVPGLSLLDQRLPEPDPRLNLNNQPWSQPVVFRNASGSLRYTQSINADWSWQAHWGTQQLRTDDRLAYPYGCGAAGLYDRYCANGDFDLYDYRSENERRDSHALKWQLDGQARAAGATHHLRAGVLLSRHRQRGEPQSDNNAPAGVGNLYTLPVVAPLPLYTDPFVELSERSTELYITDRITWNERVQTWAGWRHTRLDRRSERTDGSRATQHRQQASVPWLATTVRVGQGLNAYASWGQGLESEVAPGRARYTNRGEALPALKSRQWELGLKGEHGDSRWQLTWFDIRRPQSGDLRTDPSRSCSDSRPGSCTRVIDGDVRHQGLELGGTQRLGPWRFDASATWIHAERQNAWIDPSLNGQRPTNVPRWMLRAQAEYTLASVPGMRLGLHLSHEGRRNLLPDASLTLPSWTRVDALLRHDTQLGGHAATWTVAIENLFDRRHFKEAPWQYEHIYLFPGTPRTLRVALNLRF